MATRGSCRSGKTGQRLLGDVTVVEIAHPLTEYAGLILAGLGADVWLVEPPHGASTRQRRPLAPAASESRQSIPFMARNLGKKSVTIDPSDAGERETLRRLLARADVVLEHESTEFREDVAASADAVVRVMDPDGLGVSSIVGFAASGALSSSGWPHQPPCNAPSWLALDSVGTFVAATAALMVRTNRLGGQLTCSEVPYTEAAIAGLTGWTRTLYSYQMSSAGQGAEAKRLGSGPFPIFPCADGYVRVIAATPGQWSAFLELLGKPDALMGEEWESFQFRNENFDAIFFIASEIMSASSANDMFHRGQQLGLPITPVLDVPGVMNDAHVVDRQLFGTVDDPDLGALPVLRAPVRVNDPAAAFDLPPAPALGEHVDEARRVADTAERPSVDKGDEVDKTAPLKGLRVLSLGVGAVMPEATSFLALLGAEVFKLESMEGLDFFRRLGIDASGDVNGSPTFNQANLGVKSCAINMSTSEGRAIARRLVEQSDVIMENMRGTVMRKWGLDYESVSAINPGIIYLSSQGLGAGPYDGYTTYGPNLQSFAGMTTLWAHPDDPYPVGSTLSYPDHLAGRQSLSALFAALLQRDSHGRGCFLDCAQFEVATWSIADKFLQQAILPGSVEALGNRSLDVAPHSCYPCAGDDAWCAIAVSDPSEWDAFVQAVDEPWALEKRFESNAARLHHVEELDAFIAAWTAKRTPADLEAHLRSCGVPASRMVDGKTQSANQSLHENGFYTAISHPTVGVQWYTGMPLAVDGYRPRPRRAPLLGEHSEQVFFDLLGMAPSVVSKLTEDGIIGT